MEQVNFLTAFFFGLLSFISPCVLPIVPGYLSFISGLSFDEMLSESSAKDVRKKLMMNSLMFVMGFSTVFILLGASASVVGKFLQSNLDIISKIAGGIIIIFGLHMIGVFKIKFLQYEKRFQSNAKPLGLVGTFVVGLAFAFGWTPCIGPILASILAIAAQQESVGQGILLLTLYSAGLGIPFLLTALSISAFYKVFNKFKKHLHKVEIVGGVLLVVFGILIMTNSLTLLSALISEWFPFLNELG
ncbi:MAG: sulfite exporter TauE/SafE family protein [Ignavibacteriales bacterium]|nr:sulfite exporter TauE/SafE family protein [Ignavibacteriales bacterium]